MQVIRDFLNKHKIEDKTFAVGVSGGADSLALVLLLKEECPDFNIVSLTVDHGLRPSSKQEAEYVAKIMKEFNIEHHILTWIGEKPTIGIEEQARIARYNLLCDWCKNNNISYMFIAHHLLDQAETFLMRLQRGSGVIGLSSMDEISDKNGIKLLRPLLGIHPNELKSFLNDKKINWVEDESNQCLDFLRVKMRKFLPVLEEYTGITAEKIYLATQNLQGAKTFLIDTASNIIKNKMHKWKNCAYSVDYTEYMSWHSELKFYIVANIIKELGKKEYTPEADSIKLLILELENNSFDCATLSDCIIQVYDSRLYFIKEYRKKSVEFKAQDWNDFLKYNPDVRGIKIPHKLKEALLLEKIL